MSFSIEKARKLQELINKLIIELDNVEVNTVGGVDVAYSGELACGVLAVFSYPELKLIDIHHVFHKITVPYVPTLLFMRESPVILRLLRTYNRPVDVLLIDGHGIAHPRRCGLATYIGVVTKLSTIGVAKSLLYGKIVEEGSMKYIVSDEGERIGAVIAADGRKYYVSVGNFINLDLCIKIVKQCIRGREVLPVSTAHKFSRRYIADRNAGGGPQVK